MKPDDEYLLKLGFAHYRFQLAEWAAVHAIHDATGDDVSDLGGKNPGKLASRLTDAWKDAPELAAVARRYRALVTERNHLAHSHPASQRDGKQRLYRHDVKAKNRPQTVMWITAEWLDEFIATAEALNRDIQAASAKR